MIERYTRPEMGLIWSEENKYKLWFDVETAVFEAMTREGIIPEEAFQKFRCRVGHPLDNGIERIKEIEEETRHDVAAFVQYLEEYYGPEIGKWFHFGLTSSDVLDTSFALQLMQASDILIKDLTDLTVTLEEMAHQYKDTVMIGRSHGIHAEPITFGLMLTSWYEETKRNVYRLLAAQQEVCCGKISGPVGTYSNVSPNVEEYVCKKLELIPSLISTQVIPRDAHAYFFTTLAVIASSLERFATQIRHMQRTEVGEVQESFGKDQKGSSAMPHKRNPILSENITGLCRLIRGYATPSLENVSLWHERDMSHSSVERVVAPDATILLDFALNRFNSVLKNLVVKEDKMRKNLESSGGLYASQTIMLALIHKGMSRNKAYKIVQHLSSMAVQEQSEFRELVICSREVSEYLNLSELNDIFDPKNGLAHVDTIFYNVYRRSSDQIEQILAKEIAQMSEEDVASNVETYFNYVEAGAFINELREKKSNPNS